MLSASGSLAFRRRRTIPGAAARNRQGDFDMENRLADKKAQGIPSYGTFTQLKSAAAVENIACAPFDFVVIDTEHQAFGTDLMASAVASAQGAGLTPLVRICEISRRAVLHPLDAGAAGLIVPPSKPRRRSVSWSPTPSSPPSATEAISLPVTAGGVLRPPFPRYPTWKRPTGKRY